jgi:hypothetical protein
VPKRLGCRIGLDKFVNGLIQVDGARLGDYLFVLFVLVAQGGNSVSSSWCSSVPVRHSR